MESLLKMIPIERFYLISIYPWNCSLQADYNPSLVLELTKHKFIGSINTDLNGWLNFKRSNITVTLT